MHFPKFWARSGDQPSLRGDPNRVLRCWRWSDVSVEDARWKADARGSELAGKLREGAPLDRYLYGDRPMREQIVETIGVNPNVDGASVVITRNQYGALVLNTARAMFIDIDFPEAAGWAAGLLGRIFKKGAADDRGLMALDRLRIWATRQQDIGLRVYRTFSGLRCLVTTRTFDPASDETLSVLRETGSDPLYIRLCLAQKCFRARLTPKPWRCRIRQSPPRYPWANDREESAFRAWQSTYDRSSQRFGVCQLIDRLGPEPILPEIASIVNLHDQHTCSDPSRPLA